MKWIGSSLTSCTCTFQRAWPRIISAYDWISGSFRAWKPWQQSAFLFNHEKLDEQCFGQRASKSYFLTCMQKDRNMPLLIEFNTAYFTIWAPYPHLPTMSRWFWIEEIEQSSTHIIIHKCAVVLPYVYVSADGENEYFSDGISEEIINALTSVKGLKVIPRTSF